MPKTQVSCPNCRKPVIADLEQIFDMAVEPQAKDRLLSGGANLLQCPFCGYQGSVPTPMVYHDPAKELLLTFYPPTTTIPPNERERQIGQLIKKVVDALPAEKRKGYLFSPQTMLTMQVMVETILEADGITKEMIKEQQDKMSLLQRMIDMSDDVLAEVVKQEDEKIDEQFFALLSAIAQASGGNGDRSTLEKLAGLQQKLLELSTFGNEVKQQNEDMEEIINELKKLGEGITRQAVLTLAIESKDNPVKISTMVSMVRQIFDYDFFALLSARIEGAKEEEKASLEELRKNLLELTEALDKEIQQRLNISLKNLDSLLNAEDIPEATMRNLQGIDEFFLQVLEQEMGKAQREGNNVRLSKMQLIINTLQQASTPPQVALIQELLETEDDGKMEDMLKENQDEINEEFLKLLAGMVSRIQEDGNAENDLANKLQTLYRKATRISMSKNLSK
ncbi:MAG: hypothetical protein JXA19_01665 [Anaerolineales bacterium]|nr:hypothetical protein [Anaerolineales bacterium]